MPDCPSVSFTAGDSVTGPLRRRSDSATFPILFCKLRHSICVWLKQVGPPKQGESICSGPNVVPAKQYDTDKSADFDLVWALEVHRTGISGAALRIIDRAILPASVTLPHKTRDKNKPDNRMVAFRWIRIVNIGFLFPFTGLRLAQRHDPGAEFAAALEHLKCGVFTLPEPDRGCSVGRLNCRHSQAGSEPRREKQILKSPGSHMFCQVGQALRITPAGSPVADLNPETRLPGID